MKRWAFRWTRRTAVLLGALLLALGIGAVVVVTRLEAQETYTHRVALGRDVVKLAIVVMANQTPITPSDATAILPVLQAIKAPEVMNEELAAELDGKLQAALSDPLKQAVSMVRLPEPKPEARARIQQFLERRRPSNPAKYGPTSRAFERLVEFFAATAGE